jgi:hypothetical protein
LSDYENSKNREMSSLMASKIAFTMRMMSMDIKEFAEKIRNMLNDVPKVTVGETVLDSFGVQRKQVVREICEHIGVTYEHDEAKCVYRFWRSQDIAVKLANNKEIFDDKTGPKSDGDYTGNQ